MKPLKKKVPFSLELKRETFENIEKLIAYSQKVKAETIQEDLLSSCLFLLKMQVFHTHFFTTNLFFRQDFESTYLITSEYFIFLIIFKLNGFM